MKILYISNSTIPSRTANSIHVIKMCHAFADNGHEVILLAPDKKKSYEKKVKDIYEYYGVKKNFTIKKLWYPNIKGGAFFYTLAIFFYLIINKNFNLVYGRFIYGCYIASLLKNETIYESHAPIYEETKYGLRFLSIAPGPIYTDGAFSRLDPSGKFTEVAKEKLPLGRLGEKEELANLVTYLTSDYNKWMTGQIINLDGGEVVGNSGEFNILGGLQKDDWVKMKQMILKKSKL